MPNTVLTPPPAALAGARAWCPAAVLLPELGPAEAVEVAAAPTAPDFERGWLSALLPGLSALGMLGFALLSPNVIIVAVMGGVAVISTVGMVYSGRVARRRHEQQWAQRVVRYRSHLGRCDQTLAEAAHRQTAHAQAAHPSPELAAQAAELDQIWEASAAETGLRLRLGTGRVTARRPPRLATGIADSDGDPELQREAAALVGRHSAVDAIPVHLDLTSGSVVVLTGEQLPTLRALVVSLTRAYRPELLRIHVLAPAPEASWLRLLPQTASVASSLEELRSRLRAQLADEGPHHLLIDATGAPAGVESLASILRTAKGPASLVALLAPSDSVPTEANVVLENTPEGSLVITRPGPTPERQSVTRPDALSFAAAETFALALSRHSGTAAAQEGESVLRLATLLSPPVAHPLMIPIGRDDDGARVLIDLREAASGGHGPHGLIIGCTGSGKSELLRTLLVAAAHQSTPNELALLLIDYKGGAAFAELSRLPHVAGLLTNLSADPAAVDRMCASLRAELKRRQQLLRGAGVADIDRYQRSPLTKQALPRLLVVVDEYAELIEESPEALEVLTSLGRLGRSLGVHLLLSSQRLDDGRLRGLDAHLRLRVCLRTLNASDSISVIGSPAASKLPSAPGLALLSLDGALTRIRVALADAAPPSVSPTDPQVRQVCLPPLPEALSLDAIPDGLSGAAPATAPVGLLDLPECGAQHPLVLDLRAADAHVAIAGAPRSGRSTALAGIIAALATTTAPKDLAFHVITSATSPLAGVAGLPHVGTVATSPELGRRVVLAVAHTVAERQRTGQSGSSAEGRIVLVIDDLGSSLSVDDEVSAAVTRIATVGLSVGVSLAISCGRWLELRGGLREAIGTRWELRLNDPADSQLPALARRVTNRPAGRILTAAGEWAQLALPRLDGIAGVDDLNSALSNLVAAVARRGGPATRPIQLLPEMVPAQSLPMPSRAGLVAMGVCGPYTEAREVPFGPGEHFLVLGNSRSGRSGLLRTVVAAALSQGTRVWLIDPRRSLTSLGGRSHRHASSPEEVARLVQELVDTCREGPSAALNPTNIPGEAGLSHEVKHLLVIDDLELAEGRDGGMTLAALNELLPFAAVRALTVVVARRVSGSGRAAYNAFYGRFLEFCDSGIVLSGDPAEGPVFGGLRPARRPAGRGELLIHGETIGEIQTGWLSSESDQPRNRPIPVKSVGNPRGWV
jgi:S-DNA-T family DNA segregation ATPase FtsK/SpoIIIE